MKNAELKVWGFSAIIAVLGAAVWWLWTPIVNYNVIVGLWGVRVLIVNLILPLLSIVLLLAILGVYSMIVKNKLAKWLLAAVLAIEFILFVPFSLINILASIVLFLGIALALFRIEKFIAEGIKLRFSRAFHQGVPKMITFLFLATALLFLGSLWQQGLVSEFRLPDTLLNSGVTVSEQFIQTRFPYFSKDMTVNEFVIVSMAEEMKATVGSADLSPEMQQAIEGSEFDVDVLMSRLSDTERQEFDDSKAELIEAVGLGDGEVSDEMTIEELLKENINDMLDKTLADKRYLIPVVLTVIYFLALEVLNLIVYIVSLLLGYLLFTILKATGFMSIVKENKEVDVVQL